MTEITDKDIEGVVDGLPFVRDELAKRVRGFNLAGDPVMAGNYERYAGL